MRVRFLADFDFRPPERKGCATVAFKSGWQGCVRRICGAEAVKLGCAVEVPVPPRGGDD